MRFFQSFFFAITGLHFFSFFFGKVSFFSEFYKKLSFFYHFLPIIFIPFKIQLNCIRNEKHNELKKKIVDLTKIASNVEYEIDALDST